MASLGVPLLALTLIGLLAAGIAAVLATVRGRTRAARSIVLVAGAWVATYVTLLVVTSIASRERTLAIGETKRFCGFYLDCHMGVAVERVDTMSRIGESGDEVRAGGTFYVVTLRVSSDARRVPLHLEQPRAVIVDAEGFRQRDDKLCQLDVVDGHKLPLHGYTQCRQIRHGATLPSIRDLRHCTETRLPASFGE